MSHHHPASPDYFRSLRFGGLVVFEPTTITMAIAAASAVASAAGSIMSGNAARGAANFQAAQMNQQAGQERAVSQRQSIEQRRQAGLANSRVTAVAGASGAGVTDPTVLNIEGDNAATGEYNALTALYQGEEKARGLEMGATSKVYEGQQARQASLFKAGGTLLSSGNSMLSKYGDGGFESGKADGSFENGQYGPSSLPWQNVPGYTVPNYS